MHLVEPAPVLVARVPVRYVVFDVLRRDDDSPLSMPYGGRRSVLGGLGLRSGITPKPRNGARAARPPHTNLRRDDLRACACVEVASLLR